MEILNIKNLKPIILESFLKERYNFMKTSKIILDEWEKLRSYI